MFVVINKKKKLSFAQLAYKLNTIGCKVIGLRNNVTIKKIVNGIFIEHC